MRYDKLFFALSLSLIALGCNEDTANQSAVGQGGSMTRFAINNENLYVVSNQSLVVYNISQGGFERRSETNIGNNIETIFARAPYLYIGSTDAMYIYSIAQPEQPTFVFAYAHLRSCDPVVVQENRAYVTMRSGNFCNEGNNALEILDISNPNNPQLIANYPMESPHGLGVRNNYLFLCEGENGFKVFDISNEKEIKLLKHITTFHAYDVIAHDNWIAVTGEDGIFQFQYPVEGEVVELRSKIPVVRDL
jgi:hypothetical protein